MKHKKARFNRTFSFFSRKAFSLGALRVGLSVSLSVVFSHALAASVTNNGLTKNLPLTSYFTQEAYTRGYTSLALNYPFVRQQMIADIRQGKGKLWLAWITAGTQQHNSLSWWMLSEWYFQHKKSEQAYEAAIQALVISKTELKMCDINDKDRIKVEHRLLSMHSNIVKYQPKQVVIKRAVMNAFTRTEHHIKTRQTLSSQTCYLAKADLGYNIPDDVKIWERDLDESRNKRALRDVREEMGYDRFFEVTDINDVWNSEQALLKK